jgi:hypothetical protein
MDANVNTIIVIVTVLRKIQIKKNLCGDKYSAKHPESGSMQSGFGAQFAKAESTGCKRSGISGIPDVTAIFRANATYLI